MKNFTQFNESTSKFPKQKYFVYKDTGEFRAAVGLNPGDHIHNGKHEGKIVKIERQGTAGRQAIHYHHLDTPEKIRTTYARHIRKTHDKATGLKFELDGTPINSKHGFKESF